MTEDAKAEPPLSLSQRFLFPSSSDLKTITVRLSLPIPTSNLSLLHLLELSLATHPFLQQLTELDMPLEKLWFIPMFVLKCSQVLNEYPFSSSLSHDDCCVLPRPEKVRIQHSQTWPAFLAVEYQQVHLKFLIKFGNYY
ncbi:hypothetical protein DVH24_030926 [Malus domestica]|uniref:Uncharacterized protein n=1 Tax=Malus domestica TaxID=3750 RepID=A0A498HI56_MALDO|nr:hypothetical protein DVH24_030926 [Malus domestica]